jgi:hypothetical protein
LAVAKQADQLKYINRSQIHEGETEHDFGNNEAAQFLSWESVLRIRIRSLIRIHRIHMFLGLSDPDPDPLVRGMDPDPDPALDPDPDPSIIMQK